ncbi:P-type E1-E2 ATPase [Aneurinibacillus soli]|uniref:Calcium-transporting ATPase n=1 Tax=Aneurinibacillus soli TaxID=1500254 RepID=A0A0U5BKM4_9BACL|nr:cation-translocating P-type ATPase [Aneurinibacillus soli]PYE62078.1 P-type E1-E2 ATPase [Aneurinibacillus soli]BAU28734.1 Calcium-transporting ATPase [Aneurinibacillus soli]
MACITFKERFIRSLPGRLRIEVYGLKGDAAFARKIETFFHINIEHMNVSACPFTGRVLLQYDAAKVSAHTLCRLLQQLEEEQYVDRHSKFEEGPDKQTVLETASAAVLTADAPEQISEHFRAMPVDKREPEDKPPIILTASVAGLGVLGVKQLLMGRSQLARSAGLFSAAGILSIVSGYPILKKGFGRFSREGRVNEDLVLGAAALGLALVRENLLVLAGISAIRFLQWQRTKHLGQETDSAQYVSSQTKAYASRATKLGFGLAGAAFFLTRNPLYTLGILLAANPQPCLVAEEHAWKAQELKAKEDGVTLPENITLCELAEVQELVVEDTSLLFNGEEKALYWSSSESEDVIWPLAANMVEKTEHPLKKLIQTKAETFRKTKHTPQHLEETEDGLAGKLNRQTVLFGTKRWMQKHNITTHEYELEAKRCEKNGGQAYFLSKQGKCLGVLLYTPPFSPKKAAMYVKQFVEQYPHVQVQFLEDSIGILRKTNPEEQTFTRMAQESFSSEREKNKPYLIITNNPSFEKVACGHLHIKELKHLSKNYAYAKHAEHVTGQHRKWTALWNVAGTGLMVTGRLFAPLVNLIADALKLLWITRATRHSKQENSAHTAGKEGAKPQIEKRGGTSWHSMGEEDVLSGLHTDQHIGLEEQKIAGIRAKAGLNQLLPAEKSSWIMRFTRQFKEFTTLVLLGTATLSIFSGDIFDGVAMSAVLVANAIISTLQEQKAEKVVDELNEFQPPMCKVIRSGTECELSSVDLVPGDVVVLEAGDCVPADIRIISHWNLEVNEAALTGESMAVKKSAGTVAIDTALAERTNMVYMGTNITRGKAMGIVVETGMNTEIGYLTSLLKDEEAVTPLQEKVTSISKKFVKGAFAAGILVLGVGLLRGNTIGQMIPTSVALIASAIPEGLPVTITIALSAGMRRMSKRNAIMRKLSALEALGRVSVICSDKTGTLTKNEMTVTRMATVHEVWQASGEGYDPSGEIIDCVGEPLVVDKDIAQILHIGVLCNNSTLTQEDGSWTMKGDPTEGALLTLSAKGGVYKEQLAHWQRKREIPFDSYHGTMSVICHEEGKENECFLMSKGSVEATLKRCVSYQYQGVTYPLTDEIRASILQQNESFAADALRVLGFAYRPLNEGEACESAADEQMIYVGMVGMIDPAKPEAAIAIEEAIRLGVKPVMITGDHPITAMAIGKQLGIYRDGDRVLTGGDVDRMSEAELVAVVPNVSIFARVSPEHKLRIVKAYQYTEQLVAMTGDGVNDAPAIKKADVGIAMGRTGTEVTKQSADMVLKEDHFGSIVDGVKEGRTIIGNIRKAIGCLLTGNLAEVIVSSAAVLAGMPIPLVPIQILLMNLLTDALPAAVLAVNPGNKELTTEKQDIVDRSLYKKVIIRGSILGLGSLGLFATSLAAGASLPVARTMAFATLVAGQLSQTFSWRQEKGQRFSEWTRDKFFVGALGVSWLALFSVIYVPGLARIFHTAPLQLHHLLQVLLVGSSVSLVSKPLLSGLGASSHILSRPVVQAA